jgi:hypothetical protein
MSNTFCIRVIFLFLCIAIVAACNPPKPSENEVEYPATEQLNNLNPEGVYNRLLLRHVSRRGVVNYKGLVRDSLQLNVYLDHLEAANVKDSVWSEAHELAFWINAYNAFTLRLIIRNYPLRSPLDIGIVVPDISRPDYKVISQSSSVVYDISFINIVGGPYSLNDIRDRFIREQFNEPRIHFALCNGTRSAPRLRKESYNGDKLTAQLEAATRDFLLLPDKNQINPNTPSLAPVFRDFAVDFEKSDGTVFAFINRYVPVQIKADAKANFLEYNWLVNE